MESLGESPTFTSKTCRLELKPDVKPINGSTMSMNIQDSRHYLAPDIRKLTWWERRTRLEKKMFLIGSIIILICAGILVALVIISVKGMNISSLNALSNENGQASDLCTTSDCLYAARYVLENMDLEADPCEDFFQFSCGKWVEKHSIPEDKSDYSVFAEKIEEVALKLRREIEKPKSSDEPKGIRNGKEVYEACMNTAVADSLGKESFLRWIDEFGGWPIIMKDWENSSFSWKNIIVNFTKDWTFSFISLSVYADAKNTSQNVIYVSFTGAPLSNDYLLNPENHTKVIKEYRSFMKDIMTYFANGKQIDEHQFNATMDFQTLLANISDSIIESKDLNVYYNKMTLAELSNLTNYKFNWLEYFNGVFDGLKNITENETIIVNDVKALEEFFTVIETVDNRTIANFLMWNYFLKYAQHINNVTRDRLFGFTKVLSGIKVQQARWKSCVDFIDEFFPHVTGSLYVNQYVANGTKKQAEDMIHELRISLNNVLKENTWMDEETLRKAQEKAEALVEFVAYPDDVSNETLLNETYEEFVPSHIHIENIRNSYKYLFEIVFSEIDEPHDRTAWITNPSTVNAYYSGSVNSITFPAGILQLPFFGANNLKAMNYGAVGSIIGHEITHAFDNGGRQNDKNGNLVQWWTNTSLKAYYAKSDCIRKQYYKYCPEDLKTKLNLTEKICVDGNETLNENIADNGGLKISFNAYKSWVQENGEEARLPGLDQFTPRQLFFISFAQVWCGKYTPIGLYNQIKFDEHSPGMYRIMGSLSNSEDFADAFQCKQSSNLNPLLKCSFW